MPYTFNSLLTTKLYPTTLLQQSISNMSTIGGMNGGNETLTGGGGPFTNSPHSMTTAAIIIIIYCFIFILGISGNSLVVYVVCRNKTMQSVTNVFITNLALSDILMCLLAVPFTPLSFFSPSWVFGKFLCHLVPFSLGVSVYVSTLTSLAIAIDRYFVIVHPFKPRMKLGVCILLIAVVWIVAISISLPLAIYVKFEAKMNQATCKELWPIPMLKTFFDIASLVLQYLIPFVVITYSYTKVWIILSRHTRPGKTKEKEEIELKRKKRTNRMLVAMVVIFAGCWMPLNIVHLIMEFNQNFTEHKHFSEVFFIAHAIAMSSTIYNPFLYAGLNDNFRKEFKLVIPWLFNLTKWCRSLRTHEDYNNEDDDLRERSRYHSNTFSMNNRASNGVHENSTIIENTNSKISNNNSPSHDELNNLAKTNTKKNNEQQQQQQEGAAEEYHHPQQQPQQKQENENGDEEEHDLMLKSCDKETAETNGLTHTNNHKKHHENHL